MDEPGVIHRSQCVRTFVRTAHYTEALSLDLSARTCAPVPPPALLLFSSSRLQHVHQVTQNHHAVTVGGCLCPLLRTEIC